MAGVAVVIASLLTAGFAGGDSTCTPLPPPKTGVGLTVKVRLVVDVHSSEGTPTPNITIRFLDTALPPVARDLGRVLGSTNGRGQFRTLIHHSWSDYFAENRRPGAGTFDIIVAEYQVFHYAVECLPLEDGERKITLAVVASSDTIIVADGWRGVRGRRTRG